MGTNLGKDVMPTTLPNNDIISEEVIDQYVVIVLIAAPQSVCSSHTNCPDITQAILKLKVPPCIMGQLHNLIADAIGKDLCCCALSD